MRSKAYSQWWPSPLAWALAIIPTTLMLVGIDQTLRHLPPHVVEAIMGETADPIKPAGIDA